MTTEQTATETTANLDDKKRLWEASDFLAGQNYWFLVLFLVGFILVMAVLTVLSIQHRHSVYGELSAAKIEFRKMQTEEERLILEQQTFSATPMVAERAVRELNMFYPSNQNRMTIKAP